MSILATLKQAALSDLEMTGHTDVPYELWKILAPGESYAVELHVPAPSGGEMYVVNMDRKTNTIRFPEE